MECVISNFFGFLPSETTLKTLSEDNWNKFCNLNGFDKNTNGLFVPVSQRAYVKEGTNSHISDVFHEYYGHGLYSEATPAGIKLVEHSRELGDISDYFYAERDPAIPGLCKHNIHDYEGWATWVESRLCEITGYENIWLMKRETLPPEYIQLQEIFSDAEKRMTKIGLFGQMGFPKHYTNDNALELLKSFYGPDWTNVQYAFVYGSRRPESDIDFFVVSNRNNNYFNGWLDIFEVSTDLFESWLKLLDISITDPLFSGQLIHGEKSRIEKLKKELLESKITPDSIEHNFSESERISKTNERNSESYKNSFMLNAEFLKRGIKPLTYTELLRHTHDNQRVRS